MSNPVICGGERLMIHLLELTSRPSQGGIMSHLPPEMVDYVYKIAVQERSAAFLILDGSDQLIELGGCLEHFGLQHLSTGQSAHDALVFLEGLLPIDSAAFLLPQMEVTGGIYADIHIVRVTNGHGILLLDATEDVTQHQLLQQHSYELSFLRDKLAAQNQELAAANRLITEANARMKKDLDAASKVQQALLPSCLPTTSSMDFAWIYTPCDELAGDILNVFKLDDRYVGFYLLDVSGHGVPAALLAVSLSRLLAPRFDRDSLILRADPDSAQYRPISPAEVTARLNRQFVMDHRTEQFFTLVYGLLDTKTYDLSFVSAGHPAPVLFPGTGIPRLLPSNDLPIGFLEDAVFQEIKLTLKPGDRFYLYSDAIIEAANSNDELWGEQRMLACLIKNAYKPLGEGIKTLETEVLAWTGGAKQDDLSILALEILEQ